MKRIINIIFSKFPKMHEQRTKAGGHLNSSVPIRVIREKYFLISHSLFYLSLDLPACSLSFLQPQRLGFIFNSIDDT